MNTVNNTPISVILDKACPSEKQLARVFENADTAEKQTAAETMLKKAEELARPTLIYKTSRLVMCDGGVKVDGIEISSDYVRERLVGLNRVFPYLVTVGSALDDYCAECRRDETLSRLAFEVGAAWLYAAVAAAHEYIVNKYSIKSVYAQLNPGSTHDWPIEGQKQMFTILGNEYLRENGITLTERMWISPMYTVDGIGFESEKSYHNCTLCPMKDCPNRRAVYEGDK